MFGTLSDELEVKAPASEAWKVYGTLLLADVVRQQLPDVLDKIDVLEGDGGPGTKLKLTFPPDNQLMSYSKEQFVVVDDQKMMKVAEVFEGGYLNLGFTLYRVTFQVLPNLNDESSCTTKCILDYELKEDAAENASLINIQPFTAIMKAAANYLETGNATPTTTTNN
ncbi:unnamed protein product [Coffea canephora]|uniref:DH200=94 genomic scaffold, scaffold_1032 n=2 Tax=Coffea TaxID=13442 RepID=A0A068VHH0_COFCA|nr:S-norcoclaurine synthase 2-like [Coffea arabica]XP_027107067.1 S-norcoclaurine synthase 2-like [Coffea arabica]CDP20245.1 unnamed protein product [Coffea canephora]